MAQLPANTYQERSELKPTDYEIQRHIDRLDQHTCKIEAKWGIDGLQKLVPLDIQNKWATQIQKLNDAITARDLHSVAEMVAGCIRGYDLMEKLAKEQGHKPYQSEYIEVTHPENGDVYRIALNNMDASRCQESGIKVYTLHEVVRLLALKDFDPVNSIKEAFPGATVSEVQDFDFSGGGDSIPF